MTAAWALLAQAVHEAGPAHASPSPGAAAAGHAAAEGAAAEHHGIAEILMHHVVDQPYGNLYIGGINLGPTKHMLWFGIAAALVLVLVRLAMRSYRKGVPHGLGAAVETLVVYVRDEIAEKNINLSVTMGLAIVSFLAMQWAGISKYGVVPHFQNMIPPGLPLWLLPIMIPVELLAMFTRPFALMIRLFANMLAGHMVIASLLLLIPLMAGINVAFGVGMVPISLVLALFIMMLEILVAFIQAYIFTLLTSIFIGMNAHPAH
jgi:F-type H+-transporting ATPase subunit a